MLIFHSSGSDADLPHWASLLEGSEILVIESDSEIRAMLTDALKSAGARTEAAPSLAVAQQVMYQKRPALVLSNIQLADGNVCHLIRNLRQHELLEDHLGRHPKHLPVIVLLPEEAALDLIEHRHKCRALLDVGIDIVLTLPLVLEQFIYLIRQMILL
jgi:CheY-like chemotaxis protein